MARGINKVILVGNLGHPPEVRYSQAGAAITTISLATSESWKDKNGEQQERTEWHKVKFFGRLAEIAGEYLTKGKQAYIEGSLRTEKYTDKQGVEKYTTYVVAAELLLLGGGAAQGQSTGEEAPRRAEQKPPSRAGTTAAQRAGYTGSPAARNAEPREADPFPDDDIPF